MACIFIIISHNVMGSENEHKIKAKRLNYHCRPPKLNGPNNGEKRPNNYEIYTNMSASTREKKKE